MKRILTHKVFMNKFNRARTVHIYLPPSYDEPGRRFPVIYVLDGESAFTGLAEKPEWSIGFDTAIDSMVQAGEFGGAIVVAVESANEYQDLFEEYNYPRDNEYSFDSGDWRGWGADFGNWLAYELKPYIDAHFRTLPGRNYTTVFGSSLSGTYAIWLVLKYSHVYGKGGAFSPGVSFTDGLDMASYEIQFAALRKPDYALQLYLEVGTEENVPGGGTGNEKYLQDVVDFYEDYLCNTGFVAGEDVVLDIVEQGSHTTECWQKRLVHALHWLIFGNAQ